MNSKTKVILTVTAFTIVGFLIQSNSPIGALLWPPSPDIPEATNAQIPLLMIYGLIAAIGFGVAVAFLIFGRPHVKHLGLSSALTTAVHLSVFWVLGNWVIHDSLHIANGHNLWGLIAIEYAFHGTLVIAGTVLAWAMIAVARKQGLVEHRKPAA